MRAEELRIGNYVCFEKTTHYITMLSKTTCVSEWLGYDEEDPYLHTYKDIEPIPLTKEWLYRFQDDKSDISFQINEGSFWIVIEAGDFEHAWRKIENVHTAQNVWFDLTGEDLKIK